MQTFLLYDAIAALVLLVALIRGYKRGFILTLCGFLALFVALIGASFLSNTMSGPVSRALQPAIESSLTQIFSDHTTVQPPAVEGSSSQSPESQVPDESQLPLQEALDILQDSKFYQGFVEAIQSAVDEGMVSATANAVRVISDYIATQISKLVIFIISFVLILVLWFFISHALDLAFRLPVLSSLTHWGGAALGLVKGGLLLLIACWLLQGSFLPWETVRQTYLLRFFCISSPLSMLS